MGSTMPAFANRIRTEHVEVSGLRHDLSAWLTEYLGEGHDTAVCDIGLLLTELVANVVDHTASGFADVRVALDDGTAVIEVANEGPVSAVPPVERWEALVEGSRGRGLKLIRALCEQVEVDGDADRTQITCRYVIG